jgi:3-oxoacyl-[acyl-carrier protein] reductase
MSNRLEGRIAVVTGGANGIGRACCVRFADEGADVVVADLLDTAETVALVKERGREALSVHLDATSEESNEAMAQAAKERFGRIDVLVTAAGILHANAVSGDIDRDRQVLLESVSRIGRP